MAMNHVNGTKVTNGHSADIMGMLTGFQTTQLLYTAASLGIFEELNASSVPLSAITIAGKIRTDVDATERLMNACVGLRLLEKDLNGKGIALYRNSTSTNTLLVKSSPMSLRPLLSGIGELYPLWGHLKDGVKQGRPQINSAMGFGKDYFDIWSCDKASQTKQLEFLQAMHMFSKMDATAVVNAFDLSEFDTACDLGGGTGAMAVQVAATYPNTHVTVMELDHVVACAQHFLPKDAPNTVSFTAGDFFECDLPPANLYILSHVLHDWNEEKIEYLLKKVFETLGEGGAVLILEKMLTDMKDGPLQTLIFDIGMMIGTEGRERSSAEYIELLTKSGFSEQDIDVKRLPQAKWHDAILARKL